jgi:phage-related protein
VPDKTLVWLGSSRRDLRSFPEEAKRQAGFQLRRIQQGLDPNDWKPMTTIGAGVREIRVHAEGEYRVLYVATFVEATYVLHAFEKKTQRTRRQDITVARDRFRELLEGRRHRYGRTKNT